MLSLSHSRNSVRASLHGRRLSTLSMPLGVSTWIDGITRRNPSFATERVNSERIAQLERTLPTRVGPSSLGLKSHGPGDELHRAHHLVLFQPRTSLDNLGEDGSSTEYNAPTPYLRRMWAGGSFSWNEPNPLIIGEKVTEMTKVGKVEFKNDMIFVHQEKTLFMGERRTGGKDHAVKEIRTHVFRTYKAAAATTSQRLPATIPAIPSPSHTFTFTPTSSLLFRYSALTFNGHKIHYDRDWVRNVEGHPDLVVHGPLTSTLLVELASRISQECGKFMSRFEYRATSPMYVDKPITLKGLVKDGQLEMVAEQDGRVGMKATAVMS